MKKYLNFIFLLIQLLSFSISVSMLISSPLSVKYTPFRNMQNDKTTILTMTSSSTPVSSPLIRSSSRKTTSPESTSQHSNCSITSTGTNENTSQNRTFLGTGIENQINRTSTTKTSSSNKFSSILNVNTSPNKLSTNNQLVNSQSNNITSQQQQSTTTANQTAISINVDVLLKSVQQRRSPSSSDSHSTMRHQNNNARTNNHNRSTNFSIEAIMSKNHNVQAAMQSTLTNSMNNSLTNSVPPTSLAAVSPVVDVQRTNTSSIQAQLNHLYQQQAAAAVAAQFSLLTNPLANQTNHQLNSSPSINNSNPLSSNNSPISPTAANSAFISQLHQLTQLGHFYPFSPLQNFSNLSNLSDLRNLNGLATNNLLNGQSSSPSATSTNKQLKTIANQSNHLNNRSLNSPTTVYMESFDSNYGCSPASSELTNTSIENSANGTTNILLQNSLESLRNSTPTDRINIISSPVQDRLNGTDHSSTIKDELNNSSSNKLNDNNLNNSTKLNGSHCKSSLDVKCSSALSTSSSSTTESNSPNPWQEKLKPKYNCEQLATVNCHLDNKELWDSFNELGTEMIITKSGR